MTLDEAFAFVKSKGWLVSINELYSDWWDVTFQMKNAPIMSSHRSWKLLDTFIYNISKMEIVVNDHAHKQKKITPPPPPIQRRF